MKQLWVNVGSGMEIEEGFENLDNSPFLKLGAAAPVLRNFLPSRYRQPLLAFARARRTGQVRRHDCTQPLPYEPGTVDHILCSHMLEHVPAEMAAAMLADFHTVLRDGGTLHIVVPDFRRYVKRYVSAEMTVDELQDWLLFHPRQQKSVRRRLADAAGRFGLSHMWHYDTDSLTERLESVGFDVKSELDTPSSHVRVDEPESLHVYGIA